MNKSTINKNTIPLSNFISDETSAERDYINSEKKYMQIIMSLKQLRLTLGLTQAALAKKSELPRTTISKIESGSRNTTLQTIMILAKAMGKDITIVLK